MNTATLRIIDAAANRAGEGLRVVEDYLRFALDDRHLTSLAKQLRHDLAATLARIPAADRHAARDTLGDIGTELATSGESSRADLPAVAAAGFQRLQQALRSLEEFSKLIDPRAAAAFEALRYRSYTLERAADIAAESVVRLADARLYLLLDGRESLAAFHSLSRAVIAAGVDVIQLREKQLDDRQLLERAHALREATAGTKTLFVMNDRPDLALLARADGVHVGQDELSVKDVRSIVGTRLLVGVSTHSLDQARQAVLAGANYLGVGPTFPSTTKDFSEVKGLSLLRAVAADIKLPAFAIGGITGDNLADVLGAGMTRVAISGAVLSAADPAAAIRRLRERLTATTGSTA